MQRVVVVVVLDREQTVTTIRSLSPFPDRKPEEPNTPNTQIDRTRFTTVSESTVFW